MGRGGAKLGKELKGAGIVQGVIKADHSDSGESDQGFDDGERICRELCLHRMKQMVHDGDGKRRRPVVVKWRTQMRQQRRASLVQDCIVQRFEFERRWAEMCGKEPEAREIVKAMDEMAAKVNRRHSIQMAELLERWRPNQLEAMSFENERMMWRIASDLDREKSATVRDFNDTKKGMDSLQKIMLTQRNDTQDEAVQKVDIEREQIRSTNLEAINDLKVTLDRTVDDLERRFDTAHAGYVQNTEERFRDFEDLNQYDLSMSADIKRKSLRIDSVQDEIQRWRKKQVQTGRECEQRNASLRQERQTLQTLFFDLKEKMRKQRDVNVMELKGLARQYCDAKRHLRMRLDQAERILWQSEVVSRAETGVDTRAPTATFDIGAVLDEDGGGGDEGYKDPFRELHQRIGRARLVRHQMNGRRNLLRRGLWLIDISQQTHKPQS